MSMNIVTTNIKGVVVVESKRLGDERGSFERLFCDRELEGILGDRKIVQINHSRTTEKGTIRGMHYQLPPFAEMKLVRCIRGRVFDVAVDLRAGSETYLQWHAEELSPENFRMMVVPEGCAHGFQALAPDSELLYLHTSHYEPEYEGGVLYSDPAINIRWPLVCSEISARDESHPMTNNEFPGIKV